VSFLVCIVQDVWRRRIVYVYGVPQSLRFLPGVIFLGRCKCAGEIPAACVGSERVPDGGFWWWSAVNAVEVYHDHYESPCGSDSITPFYGCQQATYCWYLWDCFLELDDDIINSLVLSRLIFRKNVSTYLLTSRLERAHTMVIISLTPSLLGSYFGPDI
jgi:hypothetical protein